MSLPFNEVPKLIELAAASQDEISVQERLIHSWTTEDGLEISKRRHLVFDAERRGGGVEI